MTETREIIAYTDYKSPYAYLAKDLTYELKRDLGVAIRWLPYIPDIPSFLGSARVTAGGEVVEQDRNAHQWPRARCSSMDCRRQAGKSDPNYLQCDTCAPIITNQHLTQNKSRPR
jgi:2-hydroxychromene-2-carboxylate isomerase